jgi:hypothetical protein
MERLPQRRDGKQKNHDYKLIYTGVFIDKYQ